MVEHGEAKWRQKGGKTQLYMRVREVGEDGGAPGPWHMVTRVTDLAWPPSEEEATRAARAWRDSLVRAQAEAELLAGVASGSVVLPQSTGEQVASAVARRIGIDEAQLARPFEDYARDYISIRRSAYADAHATSDGGGNLDILRLWILPYFDGSTAMRDVTPKQAAKLLGGLADAGFSAGTICKTWTLFKGIFRFAASQHGLRPDPTYGIKNIKRVRPKVNHLEVRQADELAERLGHVAQSEAVCAARLALACGICAEEMCGLRVMSCDPRVKDELHITQVVAKRLGRWQVCEPKNEYRDRSIPMNDEIRRIVQDRLTYLRRKDPSLCEPEAYLLKRPEQTRGEDVPYPKPDMLWRQWRPIAELYELYGVQGRLVTIHDLRHTFATTFLARGGSFADLKAIMGHSTGYMTLEVYAGSDPSIRRRAMEETGRKVEPLYDLATLGTEDGAGELTGRAMLSEIFELPKGLKVG